MNSLPKQDLKPSFDPTPKGPLRGTGCQIQSTGILGGFFILVMVALYSLYKSKTLPSGGPDIPIIFEWLPKAFQFTKINRDYYDILFMVLLGFEFMVSWEFLKSKTNRFFLIGIICLGLYGMSQVALGASWFNGFAWTGMEVVYALIFLGMLIPGITAGVKFFLSGRKLQASDPVWALKTAFFRWGAGLAFFTLIWIITYYHPFYLKKYYENWRITCGYLYLAYLFLGFPYAFITNFLRGHKFENRSDPGFVLLLIFKSTLFHLIGLEKGKFKRVMTDRRNLIALRDLLVKIFFVPLMIVFIFSECGQFFKSFPSLIYSPGSALNTFNLFYNSTYHGLFVMDVSLGLIGYVCSSRWLDNKSKGVEPTLGGWLVAIACYPPFNGITEGYLPYGQISGVPYSIFQPLWIDITFKIITLLLFVIYVWATMCFGLRFSNLTNRGILTRGPYAVIRHPAYITKNIAWWFESLRGFSSLWQFIFLGFWNLIYILRGLTEERHLRQDPDYLAYCQRVKYKFIPGVW